VSHLGLVGLGRAYCVRRAPHKRKAVLYDIFFGLLAVREAKERDQRIKMALGLEGWPRAVSGEAAQGLGISRLCGRMWLEITRYDGTSRICCCIRFLDVRPTFALAALR
jgi:hypothetical protein